MSQDKIRMTAAEYREMLGLDPVTSTKTKVVVEKRVTKAIGDDFNNSMRRMTLRLIWLLGWTWMIFTFGWPGYIIVRMTERKLNGESEMGRKT